MKINMPNGYTFSMKERTIKDFKPKSVQYDGLTTIVRWDDKTATVVRCKNDDYYDREYAVAMCCS